MPTSQEILTYLMAFAVAVVVGFAAYWVLGLLEMLKDWIRRSIRI